MSGGRWDAGCFYHPSPRYASTTWHAECTEMGCVAWPVASNKNDIEILKYSAQVATMAIGTADATTPDNNNQPTDSAKDQKN